MKKLVAMLLAVLMMCAAFPALAESFTLHSGVQFGMTAEEIIEKQSARGNSFSFSYEYPYDTRVGEEKRLTGKDIPVLDWTAEIRYSFDDEGKMNRQNIAFFNVDPARIVDAYQNVYGEPQCSSTTKTTLEIPRESFVEPAPGASKVYAEVFGGGSGLDIRTMNYGYYQWLVETEGGYVAIEIYGIVHYVYYPEQNIGFGFFTYIDYYFISTEEMETFRNQRYSDI